MFYFLQISANDDCPGNRTRYSESHETKTSSHIDNKKKLEDLSSLRINWLKSKFTISSCSLLSNRFSLIVGAGVHVRSKWREEIKRLVLLIKMSQIQQRTSPNSPRHYYGKMDNPLSTTILPWVAVLRDKFCRKSEDMEELSGPCTAPSKSRIPALSTSYLPQMKLSPSFQRSFLWTGKEFFFLNKKKKMKKRASYSRPFILPHSSSRTLPGTLQGKASKKHFLVTWQIECSRAFSTRHRGLSVLFRLRGEIIIQDYGTCGNVWENGRERLLSERKTQRLLRRSPTEPLLRFTSPSLLMKGLL